MSFDPQTFKALTFFGKRFTARRIDRIQQILDGNAGISRTRLATRVAEALKWRNPDGHPKFRACLGALERLEELGLLTLPVNRVKTRASGRDAVDLRLAIPKTPVTAVLVDLQPITRQRIERPEGAKSWSASVDDPHDLGDKHPFGGQMTSFIRDAQQRILGCLLFEAMTRNLRCRDDRIGWSNAQKNWTRHLVVVNSRFVIFDGVRVPNLASTAWGRAARQLADDGEHKYQYRPLSGQRLQGSGLGAHRGHPAPDEQIPKGCLLETADDRF